MAEMPIKTEVLVSARVDQARYSLAEAADKIGITVQELSDYETSVKRPTFPVIRQIARAYSLSVTYFALPRPKPPRKPKAYRTFYGGTPSVAHDTMVAIRTVYELQENAAELLTDLEISAIARRLPVARQKISIDALATRERSRLGVDVVLQKKWKTPAEALANWRTRIERLGIFVFLINMNPDDNCRGITLLDPVPVIAVKDNEVNNYPKIFGLLHEYGHVLLRKPGISDHGRANSVEWFCNRFAAAMLMPLGLLREYLMLPEERVAVDWPDADIAHAAKKIHVSQWALALRLETLGFAPKNWSNRFNFGKPIAPAQKRKSSQGPPMSIAQRRLRRLGLGYSQRVMGALKKGDITSIAACKMLNAKPTHFAQIRTLLEAGRGKFASI